MPLFGLAIYQVLHHAITLVCTMYVSYSVLGRHLGLCDVSRAVQGHLLGLYEVSDSVCTVAGHHVGLYDIRNCPRSSPGSVLCIKY
jgi:hypothetical protein